MVKQDEKGWTVRVRFPGAQAVHLLGAFNNWSTTATPMQRWHGDIWEAVLPLEFVPEDVRLFVWRPGDIVGHLHCQAELAG